MPALPTVLVHGLIGTLDHAALIEHFPAATIAPPLLGYGPHAGVDPVRIDLQAQVDHLHATIEAAFGTAPVRLVGHSVGGAVAMLFAHRFPARVARLVSVEGNFTLRDAFWSARVAAMTPAAAEAMLAGLREDPLAWLAGDGIAEPARFQAIAAALLHEQPASTIRASARSVVEVTAQPVYLQRVREVMARIPVQLVAGERSRAGWDVPGWALAEAAGVTVMPGVGHMMMVEDGAGFARAILGGQG